MTPRNLVFVIGAGCCWGAAFLFIDRSLSGFGPIQIGELRNLVAASVIALGLVAARGFDRALIAPLRNRPLLALAAGGIGFAMPVVLVSEAEKSLPSGLSSVILSSSPLAIALVAPWVTPEDRLGRRGLAGLVIGFAGVALVVGVGDGSLGRGDALPLAALVCAAMLSAAYPLIVRRQYEDTPPAAVTLYSTLGAGVVLLPLLPLEPLPSPPPSAVLGLVALGGISTALPFFLFTTVVCELGAARASVAFFVVPVTGLLLGGLLLGESISPVSVAGLALILVGVRFVAAPDSLDPITPYEERTELCRTSDFSP